MLAIRFALLLSLLVILLQDFCFRAVHWALFPLLTIGLLSLKLLEGNDASLAGEQIAVNLSFLVMVLAILTGYLFMSRRRFINITKGLMGWGDILFLAAIGFYLSVLNYVFFYIVSIPIVLILWLFYQLIAGNKGKHIPLAGLQSLLFIVFLAGDWWYFHIRITDDYWLLRYLTPWIQQ
ncbi:hypothetical protein [Mucilaginibacter ginsenosidivorax]|uniref:Prepilin type IV endopeptidase peptidase domain-containing protein n=1 Tax=Mucilaginibacter ginsenosidivorax TaxID=862126 RepID=A0A5B8W8S9_9SPHI|nr:hypothetical protein [Mucilaginibacter ginsenosidivorax]QEC79302.1 hypothetical protein FSB76_26375 [Mucilaginibacter ginsenosidivorax]